MKKYIPFIVFAVVILIAAVTNPKPEDVRSKVKQEITKTFNEEMMNDLSKSGNSQTNLEKAGSAIGYTLGLSIIDQFVESIVFVDSYVVFSLVRVKHGKRSKVIGYGLFGNVFFTDEFKELSDSMQEK